MLIRIQKVITQKHHISNALLSAASLIRFVI